MSHIVVQNIVSATVCSYPGSNIYSPFSTVTLTDAEGFEVRLFVPTAAQAEAIAAVFRPACDNCGETGEIRTIHRDTSPTHLCAACFARMDAENSFTDFPRAA